ncbi:sigma-54-dependent Fis family transcriptional regulator [candidate division WOR-3 bacterium]|uniref:Sigma-54-dependent Fis family transcriptional regulator n=1 Tax=candidate division WOR-3 bacterium TaxID=2052148 RepID=A0A938BRE4_UNCW3|nr:sigma-54-dependent Fis family transcriptional regulator [candidate division WOR-3 bacterium]
MPGDVYEALFRVSQLFNSILDPDALFGDVLDEALRTMNAERGLLLLADAETGKLAVRVARHIDGPVEEELSGVSRTVLDEVVSKKEAKVFVDAPASFPGAQSIIIAHVRSVAVAPLISRERLVGAIYVDSRTDHNVFSDDALLFLRPFASIAALAIENARLCSGLAAETGKLRSALGDWQQFPEIVGRSAAMRAVFEMMARVIPTDAPVLITGETGTGKELVARAIHYSGPRKEAAFVAVNCGAIPENLLESELFGHRKGSFTGAVTDKQGLFEAANGGTLFLDEVSDLPRPLQPKLLRALQSGEVRRVGDVETHHVNVRVMSATNRDLGQLAGEGTFREDLYYRLNVIPIELPPLRQRRDDIPLLAGHFLAASARRQNKKVAGIAKPAIDKLVNSSWPGNIRQLENTMERAVVLCSGDKLTESDIMLPQPADNGMPIEGTAAQIEKRVVLDRLKAFNGNRTRAAASLGISRRTLLNKLAEWKREDEAGQKPIPKSE